MSFLCSHKWSIITAAISNTYDVLTCCKAQRGNIKLTVNDIVNLLVLLFSVLELQN
jgi:hypothetical protein